MKEILDKIITDEHLVWDKTLTNKKQKFVADLNPGTVDELIKRRNELDNLNENDLLLLKNEILEFKKKILDGFGLFIINGACLKDFSLKEKISIYTLIAEILGELIIQNIKQEKIVEIKDVGKSMQTGGRYDGDGFPHHQYPDAIPATGPGSQSADRVRAFQVHSLTQRQTPRRQPALQVLACLQTDP